MDIFQLLLSYAKFWMKLISVKLFVNKNNAVYVGIHC